jgi:hypothetical protein
MNHGIPHLDLHQEGATGLIRWFSEQYLAELAHNHREQAEKQGGRHGSVDRVQWGAYLLKAERDLPFRAGRLRLDGQQLGQGGGGGGQGGG